MMKILEGSFPEFASAIAAKFQVPCGMLTPPARTSSAGSGGSLPQFAPRWR